MIETIGRYFVHLELGLFVVYIFLLILTITSLDQPVKKSVWNL
jgi:hypothetical protein